MRATIVGKARDLSILYENGDKRLLGDAYVEGHDFVRAALSDEASVDQSSRRLRGFLSVFAQHSEALRRLLVVRSLDNRYQEVIDRYTDLRNLITFDREGTKLFIGLMLNTNDFNFFSRFTETNFFTELEYVIDVPFHELPANITEQVDVAEKYGYVLPTKRDFKSGEPCFFPNVGISLGFEHPKLRGNDRSSGATQLAGRGG